MTEIVCQVSEDMSVRKWEGEALIQFVLRLLGKTMHS